MKRFLTIPLALSFLAALHIGCQEEIDLDLPDNEPELVVEGFLVGLDFYIPETDLNCFGQLIIPREDIVAAADTLATFDITEVEERADYFPFNKVKLSTTDDYFANGDPPVVSGASVTLVEDGVDVEILLEDADEAGTYRITHAPKVGSRYWLRIQALDKFYETEPETYEPVPPLVGVSANYGPNFLQDSCAFYLGVETFEKPGLGDHYRWFMYINDKFDARPGFILNSNDDGIDGFCLFGLDIYGDELELGDTIITFQMRTSENYFNFMNTIRSQTAFVGSPFDAPPSPIRGNLKNVTDNVPAYGYFAVGGIAANGVEVPKEIPPVNCP